jgi:hypothetical protein
MDDRKFSEFHRAERVRRFVIYVNYDAFHTETVDREQAMFVKRLLESDGVKGVRVQSLSANQQRPL